MVFSKSRINPSYPADPAHLVFSFFSFKSLFEACHFFSGNCCSSCTEPQKVSNHISYEKYCFRGSITCPCNFGYRRHQVYIRNSRHTPPAKEYLLDSMEAFFQCLQEEDHPGVRAVLGHCLFVSIHPYMDGNGRTGRFLMNAMLASGGYPWTIIQVEHRDRYFVALESASVDANILPFIEFVVSEMDC